MSENLLTNQQKFFKTVEYTGNIEAGEGLEFNGNVLSISGIKTSNLNLSGNGTQASPLGTTFPKIQLVATEEEAVSPNILYVVTGAG